MESLRIGKLIKARSKEIEELKLDIKSFNGRKLIFQKLPRYMRRRQMSWNPKRLPKRLQVAYCNQLKKSFWEDESGPVKKKRPRRFFRPRSKIVIAAYRKRALKCRWLETHVWHAKRFHMVQRWGYKIANSSYEKSFRRCYRGFDRGCLVQDISFYNCFELVGPEEYLPVKLEELINNNTNRPITSETYKTGYQRGSCIIYNYNTYPYGAIGPISFLWVSPKRFWFWVHPAFCTEIMQIFNQAFNFDTNFQNVANQVSLTDLKLKFNMFRLTGPKSLKMLQDMLKVPSSDNCSEWFKKNVIANNNGGFEMFQKQVDNWNALKSYNLPSQLCNNEVINLTVMNPKCVKNLHKFNWNELPVKSRTKSEADASFVIPKYVLCSESSDSTPPPKKIKVVMKKKSLDLSQHANGFFYDCPHELSIPPYTKPPCDQRLVPGEFYDVTKNAEVIPVVLIQRPGNRIRRYRNLRYGSGIDLLVPKEWGRTFWYCMQLRKAAAVGQRVSDMVNFEMGSVSLFAPDYKAGQQELKSIGERLRVEYFKRPPKCRLNYRKLGILMPFEVNWETLVNNWKTDANITDVSNGFFVLRDKVVLEKINNCLRKFKHLKMESVAIPEANNCLVPIRLTFKNSKGCVSRLSPICLPRKEDVSDNLSITEPNHKDPNEDTRKIAKKEHKRLLKKYRRDRIKAIKMKDTIPDDNVAEIAKYKMENESLWLSDVTKVTDIRHSCQREVIGFVEYGDFSMLLGYGAAIGYVTANGLLTLLNNEKILANGMVLVRDKNSLLYRSCDIETVPLDIIV